MRELIIDTIGEIGGHFGANLGTCELAVALHSLLDSPTDKILWDVGHQAYPHKVLTGRRDQLDTIRQYEGLAPFCSVFESEHDIMGAGHASTSIGYGVGLKEAMRKGIGEDGKVVAVIGDGALTGGVAYEALHHAGGPADADGDRPQRQRDVDLAQRRRDLPLLPARPAQPRPLPGALHHRGAPHPAPARPRPADRAARPRGEGGDQGLLGAGPLLRGARPRLHGSDRRPRRRGAAAGADQALEADRPVVVHIHTVKGKGFEPAEEGGLEGMEKWHAAKPGSIVDGKEAPRRSPWSRSASATRPRRSRSSRSRRPRRRRSTPPSSPTRWSRRPSATRG